MGILDVPGYTRAQVDQKIADAAAVTGRSARSALPNTIMFLGDSMIAGGMQNVQRGIVTGAESVALWTVLESRGSLVLGGGTGIGGAAAVGGYTTRRIVDELLPLVEAAKPGLCAVVMGANDFGGTQTLQQTLDNFRTAFTRLRQAGVTPVVCTTPPRNGPPANLAAVNAWLRTYARLHGLPFAETFGVLADPAGPGLYKPGLTSDGGGHPSADGAKLMGRAIADAVRPFVPAGVAPLPWHNAASGAVDRLAVATNNSLLLNGGANGPSGWDCPPGVCTFSDGPTLGRQATITRDAANVGAFANLTGIAAGDRLVFAAELAATATPGGSYGFALRDANGPVAGISDCTATIEPGSVWAQELVWDGTGAPFVGAATRGAAGANVTFSRPVVLSLTAAGLA